MPPRRGRSPSWRSPRSPAPPTCACAIRCCRRWRASSASRIGGAAMVVMAFALAYGVFQIVVGPLGDARGKLTLVVLGSLWAGVGHHALRGHAEPRSAGAGAVSGRRRGGGRHPRGDRLDRRRRALRAAPAGAGALPLRADPGHRVRPGGRRPARRADRLARHLGCAWAWSMCWPACCCSSRCAASRSGRRRAGLCAWRQVSASASGMAAQIRGRAPCSASPSWKASSCSVPSPTSAPSCTSASA